MSKMTIELVGERFERANEARERIRARYAAPLMHAAETAAIIFESSDTGQDSELASAS